MSLKDKPQLVVDEKGVLSYDKVEPVENLVTWVFNEGTFVPQAKIVNGESYSIVTDHLGTPFEAYNEEGEKVWSCELDIYGKAINFTGDKTFIPFRYQGQYDDGDTELYYNRFRYYSPDSGTYISQDPIGLNGNNPSFYAYVADNNTEVDPLGLSWEPGTPKPKGWRLPQNGTFTGAPGHSPFVPSDPSSLGLNATDKIPFVKGTPDMGAFSERVFNTPGMTGVHSTDMPLIHKRMAELYPDEFKNQTSAKKWLSKNRLTPHHFQGEEIQLAPRKLHDNVKHNGSASSMRGGNH